jgi:hypothetical protein
MTISCKKSKEARDMEKEINDTRWELDYVLDGNGNDITAQVLADAVICECFEFYKADKDPVTYNTYITKCHNTYFPDYKGNWIVFDWVKREKEKKKNNTQDVPTLNRWADFVFSVGNVGLETTDALLYFRSRNLEYNEIYIVNRIYKFKSSGFESDTILEYRYYKKIS